LKQLQRAMYGRRSEKLDPYQLQLGHGSIPTARAAPSDRSAPCAQAGATTTLRVQRIEDRQTAWAPYSHLEGAREGDSPLPRCRLKRARANGTLAPRASSPSPGMPAELLFRMDETALAAPALARGPLPAGQLRLPWSVRGAAEKNSVIHVAHATTSLSGPVVAESCRRLHSKLAAVAISWVSLNCS
jgi:hypothetical protein